MRTIPAGEFKAKCLALMDEVEASGEPIVVTKRGKPVVRVTPAQPTSETEMRPLFGAMRGKALIVGDIVSSPYTDEEWEEISRQSEAVFNDSLSK
jgi:prevent-host-death family protein